jgi:hypothetical protein
MRLSGAIPMHRDLGPGDRGPDVLQLEKREAQFRQRNRALFRRSSRCRGQEEREDRRGA